MLEEALSKESGWQEFLKLELPVHELLDFS